MILLIIVLLILVLFFLIVFGTDWLLNQIAKFKRFHIGRWSDQKNWSAAVEKKALQWIKHTPTVKQTDNYHYVLIDMMKGRYRNATIQSWQTAGLVLGLGATDNQEAKMAVAECQTTMLDNNGNWKQLIDKVDFALLAYALLKSANAAQYEMLRPAMEAVIKMIENNLTPDGIISYSEGRNAGRYFVDTLGMVCPFLSLYGRIYQQQHYVQLAFNQLIYYTQYGMFEQTMLPCHAISSKNHLPLSLYGWGRGTAWYVLGLVDTYTELESTQEKAELKRIMLDAANRYYSFQNEDGGFCTILQGGGLYDSSVTAVMSYFYNVCAEIYDNKNFKKVSDKCIKRLMQSTMRDGAIDSCQGDTHGIGSFSQTFDIMPFAQGMALRGIR